MWELLPLTDFVVGSNQNDSAFGLLVNERPAQLTDLPKLNGPGLFFSRQCWAFAMSSPLLTEGREVQPKLRDEKAGYGVCWTQPRSWCWCCRTGVIRRTAMGRELVGDFIYLGRLFRAFQLVVHSVPPTRGNSLPKVSSSMNADD